MVSSKPLPQYRYGQFPNFIFQLRNLMFDSHEAAATHVYLSRYRILRYENEPDTNKPPLGYLCELARFYVNHHNESRSTQQKLIIEINKAIYHHYDEPEFEAWAQLDYVARSYFDKQKATYQANKEKAAWQAALQKRLPLLPYTKLIGLDDSINTLVHQLKENKPPFIIAIEGMGGQGKTSLAHAVATRLIQKVDDMAWVSSQPYRFNPDFGLVATSDPALTIDTVIAQLGKQLLPLNVDPEAIQTALETRLKATPHLIILDNLDTFADIETLWPMLQAWANPSKILITTRHSLAHQAGVWPYNMPGLSAADLISLIRHEAEANNLPDLAQASENQLQQIVKAVSGNPLALQLVIGQLHRFALDEVLADLTAMVGQPIENLFSYLYQQHWNQLDEPARKLLLSMPLVATGQGSRTHLAELSGLDFAPLTTALNQLLAFKLVDSVGNLEERDYQIHDLTRTFLTTNSALVQAYQPLFQSLILNSTQRMLSRIQATPTTISGVDKVQALHTLRYALPLPEAWPLACGLLLVMAPLMEQAGYWTEWIPFLEQGLEYSQSVSDEQTLAELGFHVGVLYQRLGQYGPARTQLASSATTFEQLGNLPAQAKALNRLAYVARQENRYDEAARLIEMAQQHLLPDDSEYAYSTMVLGLMAYDQAQWAQAITYYEQAIHCWKQSNEQRLLAWGLTNLGAAFQQSKAYQRATTSYQQAIAVFEAIEDPIHKAGAEVNLGNIYLNQKKPRQALAFYQPAKKIFEQAQDQLRLALVYQNRGIAYRQLEAWGQAEEAYQASIQLWRKLGRVASLVNSMDGLGLTYMAQAQWNEAIFILEAGLEQLAQIEGEPRYDRLLKMVLTHLAEAIQGRDGG